MCTNLISFIFVNMACFFNSANRLVLSYQIHHTPMILLCLFLNYCRHSCDKIFILFATQYFSCSVMHWHNLAVFNTRWGKTMAGEMFCSRNLQHTHPLFFPRESNTHHSTTSPIHTKITPHTTAPLTPPVSRTIHRFFD